MRTESGLSRGVLLLGLFAAACGGGGGGGGGTTTSPSPPPPSPMISVATTTLTRMQAAGTSVSLDINATPLVALATGVNFRIVDKGGVFQPATNFATNSDGTLTITAAIVAATAAGNYSGTLTLEVCGDSMCATPLDPGHSIAYSIDVLNSTSAWPGNHLTTLSPWSGIADWSTYQGNAGHTGLVPATIVPDAITTRWQWLEPTVPVTPINSSPNLTRMAVASGQVYVAGGTDLLAIREADASQVWLYDVSGVAWPSTNAPAVSGTTVYMAGGQQNTTYMWAFDSASGALTFRSQMSSQWEHYLAPTVAGGTVYTDGGTYGGMFAFDAATGAQKFFTTLQQFDEWTPAVDSAHAYAYIGGQTAGTSAQLNVIDLQTGAVTASILDASYHWDGYDMYCAPVLGSGGSVFAINVGDPTNNSLIEFNVNSSTISWSIIGQQYTGNPSYSNGVVYAVNRSPLQFEAHAEADGHILWTWVPQLSGESTFVGDILLTNNLAFVSTNLNTYALDLTTHRLVWSYPASGNLALSANGVFYIQRASDILAFNAK